VKFRKARNRIPVVEEVDDTKKSEPKVANLKLVSTDDKKKKINEEAFIDGEISKKLNFTVEQAKTGQLTKVVESCIANGNEKETTILNREGGVQNPPDYDIKVMLDTGPVITSHDDGYTMVLKKKQRYRKTSTKATV
jgi:hypothetical protein